MSGWSGLLGKEQSRPYPWGAGEILIDSASPLLGIRSGRAIAPLLKTRRFQMTPHTESPQVRQTRRRFLHLKHTGMAPDFL